LEGGFPYIFAMGEDKHPNRLDEFDARLRRARTEGGPSASDAGEDAANPMAGFGIAFRIGVELVAALVVGVGIGLLLDNWLGTGPWFLVAFFFLGAAAGVLNVYRAASGIGLGPGYGKPTERKRQAKKDNGDVPT